MKQVGDIFDQFFKIMADTIEKSKEIVETGEFNGEKISEDEVEKVRVELAKVEKQREILFTKLNENANTNSK